jgi:hypothetical protein
VDDRRIYCLSIWKFLINKIVDFCIIWPGFDILVNNGIPRQYNFHLHCCKVPLDGGTGRHIVLDPSLGDPRLSEQVALLAVNKLTCP